MYGEECLFCLEDQARAEEKRKCEQLYDQEIGRGASVKEASMKAKNLAFILAALAPELPNKSNGQSVVFPDDAESGNQSDGSEEEEEDDRTGASSSKRTKLM